jgi:ribosomal protein S18 acetylase RimI-like enzyme
MPEVTVFEANLQNRQHQDAIVFLVDAYARDPMGNGEGLPAEVRGRLVAGLQRHPTAMIYLAFEADEPVGIAVCFVGFSTFAAQPLLNIHDLAVVPAHRGRGVGRLLLERVEARARGLGCCKLTLEVRADNHRAQRLYTQVGFGDGAFNQGARTWFLQKPL